MEEKQVKIKLTAEGKKRYEAELNELKTVKRKEIAENLQTARAQGDLSENSEYDEAKNDQAKLEARIKELETILRNVEVIDESEFSTEKVHIGSNVKVYDRDFDEEDVYQEKYPMNLLSERHCLIKQSVKPLRLKLRAER